MTQPNSESHSSSHAEPQNAFNISNSSVTNLTGSGDIDYRQSEASPAGTAAYAPSAANAAKLTILFLGANPKATQRLRLDEELREIEAGLQRSKYRDRFDLVQRWAVRPRDLQRAMLDCNPQIVHFSGHGMGQPGHRQSAGSRRDLAVEELGLKETEPPEAGGAILEDVTGRPQVIKAGALAALFELFSDCVDCVVLNACYSAQQAEAIAQHVRWVIGMNDAVVDRAAIEFSIGFYDALGAGKSIAQSYRAGLVSVRIAGLGAGGDIALFEGPPR